MSCWATWPRIHVPDFIGKAPTVKWADWLCYHAGVAVTLQDRGRGLAFSPVVEEYCPRSSLVAHPSAKAMFQPAPRCNDI